MKKNLVLLTGIVVVIAILAAGGCKPKSGQTSTAMGENDTTRVDIFLKDTLQDGEVHLLMYDSKKPDDKVIDDLITSVHPGDTVIFKKAHKSDVKQVKNVRLVEEVFNIYRTDFRIDSGLYVLVIDPEAPVDTIAKYEIKFTVKKDTADHTIDPFLELPKDN